MTTMNVDELCEEIEDIIFSELLDETIGFSRLYESPAEEIGENWSAKAYSLVEGVPIEQFNGDLARELFIGHVTTHREMTIRGENWQVDLCASDILGTDGEARVGTIDLNISPSSELRVLREIYDALEDMTDNL
jgi:hypothetical protein